MVYESSLLGEVDINNVQLSLLNGRVSWCSFTCLEPEMTPPPAMERLITKDWKVQFIGLLDTYYVWMCEDKSLIVCSILEVGDNELTPVYQAPTLEDLMDDFPIKNVVGRIPYQEEEVKDRVAKRDNLVWDDGVYVL